MYKKALLIFVIISFSLFFILLTIIGIYHVLSNDPRRNKASDFIFESPEIESIIGPPKAAMNNKSEDIPHSERGYQSTYYVATETKYYIINIFQDQKDNKKWIVVDFEISEITEADYQARDNEFQKK